MKVSFSVGGQYEAAMKMLAKKEGLDIHGWARKICMQGITFEDLANAEVEEEVAQIKKDLKVQRIESTTPTGEATIIEFPIRDPNEPLGL